MRPRVKLLLGVVFLFALPLTLFVYLLPSEEDLWWQSFLVYFIWLFIWAVAWYDLMLLRIIQSAAFTLDANSIGYHDRFVKMSIAWRDLDELTPRNLRGRNGRLIVIRPGLRYIERHEEFVEAIVRSAGLAVAPRGGALHWTRPPELPQST